MPGGLHVTAGWAGWYCQMWSYPRPLSVPLCRWGRQCGERPWPGLVSSEEAILDGDAHFPFWNIVWWQCRSESPAGPACRALWNENIPFPLPLSGVVRCLGSGTPGPGLPAGCLRLQLAKAAAALPSERQLENAAHVLFPRNTSFFMVWQPSPSRGPVMPSC